MRARLRQEAVLRGEVASHHFARLCDALRDRFPCQVEPDGSLLACGPGLCRVCLAGNRLLVECEAADAAALECMRGLITAHLARCCGDRQACIDWAPPRAAGAGEVATPAFG